MQEEHPQDSCQYQCVWYFSVVYGRIISQPCVWLLALILKLFNDVDSLQSTGSRLGLLSDAKLSELLA